MQIEFISSVAIISQDPATGRKLFVDELGLSLQDDGGYLHSEQIGGTRHFGVWPLSHAAEACFGSPEWPSNRPIPQASIEFEVGSPEQVTQAAAELQVHGYALLHGARQEPWGQTVARFVSHEGAILGISYAPWMHGD